MSPSIRGEASMTVDKSERRVRAMWPWPRAWTTIDGASLQVHKAIVEPAGSDDAPGTARNRNGALVVACGAGALRLEVVQPAGRNPMTGSAFVAGRRTDRVLLGTEGAPDRMPPLIRPARDA